MYLITGSAGVYIIDPSVSPDSAENFTGISGLAKGDAGVKAFFLTHGHHDHIKHINDWIKAYPSSQVFFSSNDSELLINSFMNCSYMEGSEVVYSFKFTDLAGTHGQTAYKDDDVEIKAYETPGHTMGSLCFLADLDGEEVMFTGDTVFRGSVGRTDMPGGSSKMLMESARRISKFDPDLKIYPGHGPESTIGDEIKFNPFFGF
jgi:glyoxylase-like metal-dependent hydrolase (beta-lactamase superfamily II)